MKISLTVGEVRALKRAGIPFANDTDYTMEHALDLLDQVRLAETSFAKKSSKSGYTMEQAARFAVIAEKIGSMIPAAEVA